MTFQAGTEFPWLASAGADYLWLVSRHGDVQEWLGHTFLKRTRLNYRQLPGAAALPTSSAPPGARALGEHGEVRGGRATGALLAVEGARRGAVFGAGRNGHIFRQTPYESRVALTSPTSAPLLSLDGSGPRDLWAVGGGGTALHFNGSHPARGGRARRRGLAGR